MPSEFQVISSLQNPRIKDLVRLREARHRRRAGFFLIEGGREIERALLAKWPLTTLFFAPEQFPSPERMDLVEQALDRKTEVVQLSPEAFSKVAYREHPDGLLALAPMREAELAAFQPPAHPLLLVAQAVEKPGNLGALMRTANAAGVDALILCDAVCDRYNPNAIRASQGAFFDLPVFSGTSAEVRAWLDRHQIRAVATTPAADSLLWDLDLRGALALVVGAEDTGLTADWLEGSITIARLPMAGVSDSLNVSVATGVATFEAIRQRTAK